MEQEKLVLVFEGKRSIQEKAFFGQVKQHEER